MQPTHLLLALALLVAAPQDRAPLLPGVLPSDASDEAQRAWKELCDATLAQVPVRAFDIAFNARYRRGGERHDVLARIRFLAPHYLRSEITESGQGHVHDGKAYWLVDEETQEATRLVGREGAEDKRQIQETIAIARNFLSLTDPRSIRMAALELVAEGPQGLPAKLRAKAARLRWLAVESPDLRLFRRRVETTRGEDPLVRALLGIDPETKRIELALIHETRGRRPVLESALLVDLRKHEVKDGFLVPHQIGVYQIDPSLEPLQFPPHPSSELWMKKDGIDLRPDLKPEDFGV